MKKFCFAFISLTTLFINFAFGCFGGSKPLKKFDNNEYIFVGVIIGYTQPIEFTSNTLEQGKVVRKNTGLIVKIKDSFYLPKTPSNYFEVFSYNSSADCSPLGVDKESLEKSFPINTEVRIIAEESTILPNNLSDENIRLEISLFEQKSISLNNNLYNLSSNNDFDYRQFKNLKYPDSLLLNYLMRKDLFHLENVKSQNERNKILNRLLYFPDNWVFKRLDFQNLAKIYTSSESEYNSLYESYLRINLTKKQFKKYQKNKKSINS